MLGSRRYKDYDEDILNHAVLEIKQKKITYRQAVDKYNIPLGTLSRKINKKQQKVAGGQTVLSQMEENLLVDAIGIAADWGFHFEPDDIKTFVKAYLDKAGKKIKKFSNNKPGHDWLRLFLSRHENALKIRLCENIKRARATVRKEDIKAYFVNLQETLRDIPPSNIVNYDETCFADDPGRSKVLVRRKSKHPSRIMDSSKSATSVMFAASASGVMLAPYVVYKADHLWSTWTTGGPPNCRYNRTASGWFDQGAFDNWFFSQMLPYFQKCEGRKALIGDNLVTHLSLSVIQACENNNIEFVFFPPNSTHLMQPLDVSCFRPVKLEWRKVLKAWKRRNKGPVRKDIFPSLLKTTLQNIEASNSENIKSGFRATGIYPFDPDQVLKKNPDSLVTETATSVQIVKTMSEFFKEARYGANTKPTLGRRKKINVPPGQSVTSDIISNPQPSSSGTKKKNQNGKGHYDLSDTDEDTVSSEQGDKYCSEEEIEDNEKTDNLNIIPEMTDTIPKMDDINRGDFVKVKFITLRNNIRKFIGEVLDKSEQGLQVKFLKESSSMKNCYVFPFRDDIEIVSEEQVDRKMKIMSNVRGNIKFF
jgi:hypothetical protein